jgi:hypothetical protein
MSCLVARLVSSLRSGREIASFFILAIKVVRFSPSGSATGSSDNPTCLPQCLQDQASRGIGCADAELTATNHFSSHWRNGSTR